MEPPLLALMLVIVLVKMGDTGSCDVGGSISLAPRGVDAPSSESMGR